MGQACNCNCDDGGNELYQEVAMKAHNNHYGTGADLKPLKRGRPDQYGSTEPYGGDSMA